MLNIHAALPPGASFIHDLRGMTSPSESISVAALAASLALSPHPEGGYYRRWYEAASQIPVAGLGMYPPQPPATRPIATAIHYLVTRKSALHRLRADELWLHHSGGPLVIVELDPHDDHGVVYTLLGSDVAGGHAIAHCVKGGHYFGAFVPHSTGGIGDTSPPAYALVSCVVTPGFAFEDWDMADAATLLAAHPGAAAKRVIDYLACDGTGELPTLEEATQVLRRRGREVR